MRSSITLTRYYRMACTVFCLAICLALLCSLPAAAAAPKKEARYLFDIPRLRADKALIQFALQANVTLLFPYEDVRKLQTRPLRGVFTVKQGLKVLLRRSGIEISPGSVPAPKVDEPAMASDHRVNEHEESEHVKPFNNKLTPAVITLAVVGSTAAPLSKAQGENAEPMLEEVVTVGTRSAKPRSVADSPVPVDVFNSEEFSAMGGTSDITDNLKTLVPSYTATPATGDGSAFVRPTSLRGMAPDQSLVLVNGKRRHRSALVQFFAPAAGNGAHGVDVAMIPGIALKSVEVLRDGAAAQYGSDAIAGVMNFVLKDAAEGGEIQLQAGEHFEGETNYRLAGNIGLPLGDNGFVNLSIEHVDNDALSRGVQRAVAQNLINNGIDGVGADSPFGDAPFVQTWGRPESSGTRWFVNSAFELENGDELYAFGNYANTSGRYRFFYRNGDDPTTAGDFDAHSTIQSFLNNFGTGAITGTAGDGSFDDSSPFLPAGYTPFLDGDQDDSSLVIGLRGETDSEMSYDFSVSWGRNELSYTLNNTLNPDLPPLSADRLQRDFQMGGYIQEEVNVNADFSNALSDTLFLSYGVEWRQEKFSLVAGEVNAVIGAGTSGMRAPDDSNAGAHSRRNYAGYVDVEHDLSDAWLMQYALRFEDFSDFGSTVNGKIASRFSLTDTTNLRAAISTGFHAPTPGQSNIETVITTFDGATGNLTLEGLVPAASAAAAPEGGKPLEEEESVSFSLGVSTALGPVDLTIDGYFITVDNRIYRTGDIAVDGNPNSTISFYTNALDLEHKGIDLVATSQLDWGGPRTDLSFALNFNQVEVKDQTAVQTATMPVLPVSDSIVEDIENNYPEVRFTLTGNTYFTDDLNLMLRANYYGSHYDERGTINGAAGSQSAEIDPVVYFDLELGYQINDNARIVIGGSNIFDEYPDEIPDNGILANRQSVGLQYPRRTPVNYEGGSYYVKATYTF